LLVALTRGGDRNRGRVTPDDNVITDDADGRERFERNSILDGPTDAGSVGKKDDARVRQTVSQKAGDGTKEEFV
jgi:hypothetical protein